MKKINFLKQIKKERKLELVEPSEEMTSSYLEKTENCLKSAKILFKNELYENSVSESYYCMYNSLLSLLFKVGIKCENHSASIILLKEIFAKDNLFEMISFAKKERIDKQYYIKSEHIVKLTEKLCKDMILKAENFSLKIKVLIKELNNKKIELIRKSFQELFK